MSQTFSIDQTIANAKQLLTAFEEKTADLDYQNRGIFFSEMLFAWATAAGLNARQVVESGRARGHSTQMLARLFPRSRIISIEYTWDHDDARFAEEHLASHANLALLYGDANQILPAVLLEGDVVFIDGPKRMAGLFLALRALATGKADLVFVHDCYQNQETRYLMDLHVPGVFYSDSPEFVEHFRHLDEKAWESKRSNKQDAVYGDEPGKSYGPTFACIPRTAGVDYGVLLKRLEGIHGRYRLRRSMSKRLPFMETLPPM